MLFNEVFHLLFLQCLFNYKFKNGVEVVYPSSRVSATGASFLGFCLRKVSYLFDALTLSILDVRKVFEATLAAL